MYYMTLLTVQSLSRIRSRENSTIEDLSRPNLIRLPGVVLVVQPFSLQSPYL